MHRQQHPDTELLDRLRAGLLDDRPDEKAALEQHLSGCDSCRAAADVWRQLDPGALGPDMQPSRLRSDLQSARDRALSAAHPRHRHSLTPWTAAAALLLAVTAGLWTSWSGIDTTSTRNTEVAQTVPDVYEDLDFYLWLANQENGSEQDGNPNST